MALYLVQHGRNLPKNEDPEKGLSREGRADTKRIADVARGYHVPVLKIRHSGLKRAIETAEIFAEILKPEKGCTLATGLKPMDSAEEFAETVNRDDQVMVVGHLPFMEKLVSFLTTGSTLKRVIKFQNSGIVCLDQDEEDWYIKWTLMPGIG